MSVITVTGATGHVGGRIVRQLRELGHTVRAVVPPGESTALTPEEGLDVVTADFDDTAAVTTAAEGASAYFLMTPPDTRQVAWQRTQVDAARTAGAERVVKLSAYDTGATSPWTLGRWHHDGEVALRESGLAHAILRPQYFQQNLLLDTTALREGRLTTFLPPGRTVGAVDAEDIAATAVALLTTAPLDGQVVVPTGPAAITTRDVADAVASLLGIEVAVDYSDPDRTWREFRAAGRPDWWIADLLDITQNASPEVNDHVSRLTGRPARSITDAVRDALGVPSAS